MTIFVFKVIGGQRRRKFFFLKNSKINLEVNKVRLRDLIWYYCDKSCFRILLCTSEQSGQKQTAETCSKQQKSLGKVLNRKTWIYETFWRKWIKYWTIRNCGTSMIKLNLSVTKLIWFVVKSANFGMSHWGVLVMPSF